MTIIVRSRTSTNSVRTEYPEEAARLDRIVPVLMPDSMFMKYHDIGCVLVAEIDPESRTGTLTVVREFKMGGARSISEPLHGGREIALDEMPVRIVRKAEIEIARISEPEDYPTP